MDHLVFNQLPIEMRMMIFDHLVSDEETLGKSCLVSYDWRRIVQDSYSWTLWLKSMFGAKKSQEWAKHHSLHRHWPNAYIWNPVFNVQFALEDQVTTHLKTLLFKKFVFVFKSEGVQDKQFEPREWFQILCGADNLQGLQLLHTRFPINIDNTSSDGMRLFRDVCSDGHLEVVQYVYSIFYATTNDNVQTCNNIDLREALHNACFHNHHLVAQWLYSTFNFTNDFIRNGIASTFVTVCTQGYLSMAQWMHSTFDLTIDDTYEDGECAFADSCEYGQLAVLQWLHSTFSITLDFMRESENAALASACEHGYLAVVRWLCSTFEFTTDDARNDEFNAFHTGFIGGNLEIVQLLHSTFQFSINDVRSSYYHALDMACIHEDPALVEWICSTYQLTATDIKNSGALWHACLNGRPRVIQWLCSNYNLTSTDTSHMNLLNTSTVNGHSNVVQWICVNLNPTLEDINIAIGKALEYEQLKIAKWLRRKYNIIGDIRSYVKCMFRDACIYGDLNRAKLLLSIALISIEEIREKEKREEKQNELLCLLCEDGHLSIVKWLCSIFSLTADDFICCGRCPLSLAWTNGHQDLVQWLRSTFNFSTHAICRQYWYISESDI